MAIKNTLLGGTDWVDNEAPSAEDLNDTIDAAVTKIQTLSAFWLNSDLYDVYDDFESYGTGAFSSNSEWTVSNCEIAASTNAGGSGQELVVSAAASDTATAEAINLVADSHTFMRVYSSIGSGAFGDTDVSFDGGSTYNTLLRADNDDAQNVGQALTTIYTVAKGSDEYDCYIGGKMVDNVTDATFTILIRSTNDDPASGTSNVYVDDVRQSKSTI